MKREVPEGSKWCPACQSVKPLDGFPKHRSRKDGVASRCKPCSSKASIASARRNPEKQLTKMREWRANNPKSHRPGVLKRLYGLTMAEYNELFISQNSKCAICLRVPSENKLLHVDHDHQTGVVRGLLCQQCNHAIGLLQENPDVIQRALNYLS